MKKETRTVVYDDELRIEAYRFEGNPRCLGPLPNPRVSPHTAIWKTYALAKQRIF